MPPSSGTPARFPSSRPRRLSGRQSGPSRSSSTSRPAKRTAWRYAAPSGTRRPRRPRPTIWAAWPCASGPMSSPTGSASAVPRKMSGSSGPSGSPMSSSSTRPTASATTPRWTRRVRPPGASGPWSASRSSTATRATSAGPSTTSSRRRSSFPGWRSRCSPRWSGLTSNTPRPMPPCSGSNAASCPGPGGSGTRNIALYTQGQENIVTYLNAQRDYNEVVRQYRDTLIRHRRSMLRLNTAVGQRILP